jgi:hypothetical protein
MRLNTAIEVRPTQAMKAAPAVRPETPVVRYLLAGNPAAPAAVLARLSRDACPTWRPTSAPCLLEDGDEEVRRAAGFYLKK